MSRSTQIQKLFYNTLMESQYWPAEKLRDLQRTHLKRLLRHARAEVPFYKERLDPIFTASGDIDWDRWRDLPIVTRDDLYVHRDAMQAQHLEPGHGRGKYETTSGSTGAPIHITHTEYAGLAHAASTFRAHGWHNLDWSRDLLTISGDDPLKAPLPDGQIGPEWGPVWSPAKGRTLRLNPFGKPDQILDFIERYRPGYLACRPKLAQALALEALRQNRTIELDAIVSFGTGISEDEAEDCRKAFGARMFGPYSSSEARMIAYQCPIGAHHHINAEQIFVEILGEDGQPVPAGSQGRVVVTPIFNFAQPLIRYDQGDLAILGGSCSCGRILGVLERVVGRRINLFRFPDGLTIAPRVPGQLREALGARYWQVAQIAPLTIEVRYVPFEGSLANEVSARQIVREAIHPHVEVRFRIQTDINRVTGGKFIEYVCEIDNTERKLAQN